MAALGFVLDKDLSGWMRPLSFVVLGAVAVSLGALIFGGLGTLSPVISLVILVASALLILVDFNYVRKHATEDDVVWLATGIFVSILNIFLSLLNLSARAIDATSTGPPGPGCAAGSGRGSPRGRGRGATSASAS